MANGDSIDNLTTRESKQTTNSTPTSLCETTIPLGTEGIFQIRASVLGVRTDNAKAFQIELAGYGTINGGAAGFTGEIDLGNQDIGTSGYSAQLAETSSNKIGVTITGAGTDTVRWVGRLEVDITEQAMSGGG